MKAIILFISLMIEFFKSKTEIDEHRVKLPKKSCDIRYEFVRERRNIQCISYWRYFLLSPIVIIRRESVVKGTKIFALK